MNEQAQKQAAWDWIAQGRPAVLVTVAQARGSVPRAARTRMVVAQDGQIGTIGGGHLEWLALQTARRSLSGSAPLPPEQKLALGPSLGQCCGGAVVLRYEELDRENWAAWRPAPARAEVWLYGAGHVGQAVARLMVDLEIDLRWIDLREDAFPGPEAFAWSRASRMERVVSEGPAEEARNAPGGSHHLVMTHSHALDYDIVRALLRRDDLGFVGLIGSASKRARFEHRLQAQGLDEAGLARLHCPIGLPDIQGKEPAVIAVSVVAQILGLAAESNRLQAGCTDAVQFSPPLSP